MNISTDAKTIQNVDILKIYNERGLNMNFIGSKKLETERLILRATEETDLKTLWKILSIPEVNKYYLTCKLSDDWEKEKKWQYKKLEKANDLDVFQWSIILKEKNECIGQISIQENGEDLSIRDIGWFINPIYQQKGFAFETASKVIEYMFEKVKINAIETSSAVCNPASFKLMEKLGFNKRSEETHMNSYTFGGDVESVSYGLTAKEYNK